MNVKSTNEQPWIDNQFTGDNPADWVDDEQPFWSANHDWVNGGG